VSANAPPSRRPIRIGVIGATPAGGWGTAAHLPARQALEEFEVTAVATPRLTTARAAAEVFGVPLAFADDELVSSPDVDAVAMTVSMLAAGGPAGRRIPQANLCATDVAAGATVLSISTGPIPATLARAVGEFRQVPAVVALVNEETTVIETGQTVPVTAPDQVVLAGRLQGGAVASVAVQGGSAPVSPGFELRIVGAEGTVVVRPAAPDYAAAVRYHELLARIQRASDTGIRPDAL
jgi:Oxidoreductase family, NAD-binding Rossmann fold